MADDWIMQLTRARAHLDITQAELAVRSSVSLASIKAYESGKRHPSRAYLVAILDALNLERGARNDILTAAGYTPEVMILVRGQPRGGFSRAEAATLVRAERWPSFVLDENLSIIASNDAAQRLWSVDFRDEFMNVFDRNLLSFASDPRFAGRCMNWDEVVGVMVARFKQKERGDERLDDPSPVFAAVLGRFLNGDPEYVKRLVKIWDETSASASDTKMRWSYPVVWRDPVVGLIRFESVVSVANHGDATNFNDWIPLDASSWAAMERLTVDK